MPEAHPSLSRAKAAFLRDKRCVCPSPPVVLARTSRLSVVSTVQPGEQSAQDQAAKARPAGLQAALPGPHPGLHSPPSFQPLGPSLRGP